MGGAIDGEIGLLGQLVVGVQSTQCRSTFGFVNMVVGPSCRANCGSSCLLAESPRRGVAYAYVTPGMRILYSVRNLSCLQILLVVKFTKTFFVVMLINHFLLRRLPITRFSYHKLNQIANHRLQNNGCHQCHLR